MSAEVPAWFGELSDEDREFVRRFLLASGSLKDLADLYRVSYPTIRVRLDRVIAKAKTADASQSADPMERKIRVLVVDGMIDASVGKQLLATYRACRDRRAES
jgi:hypothetical protein